MECLVFDRKGLGATSFYYRGDTARALHTNRRLQSLVDIDYGSQVITKEQQSNEHQREHVNKLPHEPAIKKIGR
jgi:hypothetical protein